MKQAGYKKHVWYDFIWSKTKKTPNQKQKHKKQPHLDVRMSTENHLKETQLGY